MVVKVDYFAIRGRAECIRLALVVAGVDYEDVPTDRAALKVCHDRTFFTASRLGISPGAVFEANTLVAYAVTRRCGIHLRRRLHPLRIIPLVKFLPSATKTAQCTVSKMR